MNLNILPWIQTAFKFLADSFLKRTFPQYAVLFEKADQVLALAVDVVSAAQATGADGATKKAAASAELLSKLRANGIDLPGDKDKEICDLVVEVVGQSLKSFFKLS